MSHRWSGQDERHESAVRLDVMPSPQADAFEQKTTQGWEPAGSRNHQSFRPGEDAVKLSAGRRQSDEASPRVSFHAANMPGDKNKQPGAMVKTNSAGKQHDQEWREGASFKKKGCCMLLRERLRQRATRLSDSWRFACATMGLTVYALFGDDFRIAATHKDTDILFDITTILCIMVFLLEIVANSIAKDGYFGSFFFVLDFVPTCTLFLDLTWISSVLFCQNMEGGSTLKTGRAGRAGARAGRTVRIIRLIRLVKFYKMYKVAIEERERKLEKKRMTRESTDTRDTTMSATNTMQSSFSVARRSIGGGNSGSGRTSFIRPGEEDEDDDHVHARIHAIDLEDQPHEGDEVQKPEQAADSASKPKNETRVGKKLSEMTTRRVIILVLVMLFGMPQFLPSSHGFDEFRSSAAIGMELVYEKWRKWCPMNRTSDQALPWCLQQNNGSAATNARQQALRWWFEKYLLTYIHSHHAGAFAWTLTWVGVESKSLTEHYSAQGFLDSKERASRQLASVLQLAQERYLGSALQLPSHTWDDLFANPDWTGEITELPQSVKSTLTAPWSETCLDFTGVAVIDVDWESPCSLDEELRCSEVEYFIPATVSDDEDNNIRFLFAFDSRGITQFEAGLSMIQTVFICCAVGIGAMTFSNDANQLLLKPIERMISKMESIKDNPLEAMRLGDLEYRREEIEAGKRKEQLAKKGKLRKCCARFEKRRTKEPMETVILEKTIIKLGGLLALGFGEAGAEIIGHNMSGGTTAGVNAMVPGQKVDAIVGFCHIRHFAHATQVLKEKVMLFVNQVGEIVHGCVDDYHGAPNKNMGDAFLLVWRLSGVPHDRQKKLADMAIMSYVRIIAEVNKSPVLAEYRDHPGMLQRVPGFRVQLGFGLHCGWAIEGAIGSDYKIDASYLSPNVNVASRLEAATKQFGVWILMSHFMISLCSPEMALYCRLIDHVAVKGSKNPVRVYTIDLDIGKLEIEKKSMDKVIKNRFKVRQLREFRKGEKWSECYRIWEAFRLDYDIVLMRSTYSSEFFKRFFTAYRNYEAGEWMVARDLLYTCHYEPKSHSAPIDASEKDWPIDGPTSTLLKFMRKYDYWPPEDWRGHRELTQK